MRPTGRAIALGWVLLAVLSLGSECNIGGDNTRLTADAEFDPDTPANAFAGVSETTQAVAQTFTILADGKFEQIDLVVTQGASADSGIVRVDVRPTDAAGVPDLSAASAIASLEIDTLDLPPTLVDEFTTFDFGDQPGRKVRAGEVYAAVVEFVSRDGSTDDLAIATVLGVGIGAGDPYPDGEGFTGASGIAFMPNTDEYFFRTFSRQ